MIEEELDLELLLKHAIFVYNSILFSMIKEMVIHLC